MTSGTILLVGVETATPIVDAEPRRQNQPLAREAIGLTLECVEILGRSMLDRWIERSLSTGPAVVTVLIHSASPFPVSHYVAYENVKFRRAENISLAAMQALDEFADIGIEHALIANAKTYAECDVADLIEFHREARRSVTGTYNSAGPLGMWVANCAKVQYGSLDFLISPHRNSGLDSYFVWNYTHSLESPADIRKLVVDSLRGACAIRPSAREVRPGVFVAEGAQIHKRARIVAPVFIGRDSRVREDTLITRCSNIESGCYVDCGTAIEDSSILSNTYVGLCLDVAHSIVQGNTLLNTQRNVELRISDDSVVRDNVAISRQGTYESLASPY